MPIHSPARNFDPVPGPFVELKVELVRRIAAYVGAEQKRITEVPGLTVHRRTAPTAPCS